MKHRIYLFTWALMIPLILLCCLPAREPLGLSDGGVPEASLEQHKLGAIRQVAINPTGNGFYKVLGGVPTGGLNTPVGDQVDLSTSNDVKNVLQFGHGGTGLSTLCSVGQSIRTNAGSTGYECYTPSSSSSSSGGASAGAINTVQLSDGAGAFLAATNVLGGTSFLSAGTSPANAGAFRVSNNVPIAMARNAAGSGNITGFDTNTSDALFIGTTSANTSQAVSIQMRAAGTVNLGIGATNYVSLGPALLVASQNTNVAILGSQTGSSFASGTGALYVGNTSVPPTSGPSNGGVMYAESGSVRWRGSTGILSTLSGGVTRLGLVGATTYTLSAIQASRPILVVQGSTNGSNISYPAPSADEDSFYRVVRVGRESSCGPSGGCTGTFTVSMVGGGTSVTVTTDSYSVGIIVTRTEGVIKVSQQVQF